MGKSVRKGKARPKTKSDISFPALAREIGELGHELTSRLQPKQLAALMADRIVERYAVAVCGIWILGEGNADMDLSASTGKSSLPAVLLKEQAAKTLAGRSIRLQKLVSSSPKEKRKDELSKWVKKHKLEFAGAFPLICDSRVVGSMLVACEKSPSESLLSLLEVQATVLAVLLRNAELIASSQHTLEKLSILVESSKAMSSTLDLSELLARILDIAKSQTDAERGTLFLVDEKAAEIWSLIAHGLEKQEIRLPLGKGIATWQKPESSSTFRTPTPTRDSIRMWTSAPVTTPETFFAFPSETRRERSLPPSSC